MSGMDKQQLEHAAKVAQVIAENPGLPIMCLAPSTPCDYDSYYHNAYGASVCKMLRPLEVEKLYGDTFGLNPERYYTDVDEVAEKIEDCLWNNTTVGTSGHRPEAYVMHEWIKVYRPIAHMMAESMPWHDCIVIDCY